MPLNDVIPSKDRMQLRLQGQFSDLPSEDKAKVIKLIQLGKRTVDPNDIDAQEIPELSEEGKQFVDSPLFREIYDVKVHREPPPETPNLTPLLGGLMEVIKLLSGGKGLLKEENANLVGGGEDEAAAGKSKSKSKGGFEDILAEGYKKHGPKGLAAAHKMLVSKDKKYTKFLEGK